MSTTPAELARAKVAFPSGEIRRTANGLAARHRGTGERVTARTVASLEHDLTSHPVTRAGGMTMPTEQPATLICGTCLRITSVTAEDGQFTVPAGWSHTRTLTAGPSTVLSVSSNGQAVTSGYTVARSAWDCPNCQEVTS